MAKTKSFNYEAERVYDAFRSEFTITPTDFTTLEDFLEDVEEQMWDSPLKNILGAEGSGKDALLAEARQHWESEATFEERVVEGETELVERAGLETAVERALRGEGTPAQRVPTVEAAGAPAVPRARARVRAPRTRARVVVPAEQRLPVVEESPGGRVNRVVQEVSATIDDNATGRRARAVVDDLVTRLRRRLGR